MHMSDTLVSPVIGGTLWAVSAGAILLSARHLRGSVDDGRLPLMGVLGAFIFAVQMINVPLPGTGASGHLGGGLLLAILLGPWAALIVMASVLTIQALFFADGGLLALGCNIFNLGICTALVSYPVVYRRIAGSAPSPRRLFWACLCAAVVALQLGACGVVVETVLSGFSALPLRSFLLLMQPVHLTIGLVEGVATAAIAGVILQARPELAQQWHRTAGAAVPTRRLVGGLLALSLLVGGVLSLYASEKPDGLEWALARIRNEASPVAPATGVHAVVNRIQTRSALLPDYSGREGAAGTGVAGVLGVVITVAAIGGVGVLLQRKR